SAIITLREPTGKRLHGLMSTRVENCIACGFLVIVDRTIPHARDGRGRREGDEQHLRVRDGHPLRMGRRHLHLRRATSLPQLAMQQMQQLPRRGLEECRESQARRAPGATRFRRPGHPLSRSRQRALQHIDTTGARTLALTCALLALSRLIDRLPY
ncbi:hypothetical protein PMAYCL1PPCAC_05811, partial [Pristionchus mayeri]